LRFSTSQLAGLCLIDVDRHGDERGHFARTFCVEEFAAHGLPTSFIQCNTSFNLKLGTLRGMHWQDEVCPEGKLVRCSRGAVFDVAVDMRQNSETRYQWFAVELSAENGRSLYIPPGFAHGFQTLRENTEVFYQMTARYVPELARGARFDDPVFAIRWPFENAVVSKRDQEHAMIGTLRS
jgi:dTDP-4-dehydrorhamnose 3,5-epimerase